MCIMGLCMLKRCTRQIISRPVVNAKLMIERIHTSCNESGHTFKASSNYEQSAVEISPLLKLWITVLHSLASFTPCLVCAETEASIQQIDGKKPSRAEHETIYATARCSCCILCVALCIFVHVSLSSKRLYMLFGCAAIVKKGVTESVVLTILLFFYVALTCFCSLLLPSSEPLLPTILISCFKNFSFTRHQVSSLWRRMN